MESTNIEFGLLLSKFKKVDIGDAGVLRSYWVVRETWAPIPRYEQSIASLVGGGCYYWLEVDGVLLLISHTTGYFAFNGVYFIISKSGDINQELRYVNLFLENGFSFMVSNDELVRWGLEGKPTNYEEYVYDMPVTSRCEGHDWVRFRNEFRKLTKLPDYHHVVGLAGCEDDLFTTWDKYHNEGNRGVPGHQLKKWKRIKPLIDGDRFVCHSIWAGGIPIAMEVLERITDKQWITVLSIRNYSEEAVALCHDCHRGFMKVQSDLISSRGGVYSNWGGCGLDESLRKAKLSLHPCEVLGIYKVSPMGTIDKDFVNRIFRGDIDFLFM